MGSPAHVNPADLEDYAYHVVRYAHESLAYFELFNEQNLAFEWGGPPDPAAFARLMAAAYRGVKRADPSIPVYNGGPAQRTGGVGGAIEDVEWLDRFLAAGGGSSIDALGVHAYMGSFSATADPSCQPLCFGQVNEFRAVMQRHGAPQSIYVTEFGALEDTAEVRGSDYLGAGAVSAFSVMVLPKVIKGGRGLAPADLDAPHSGRTSVMSRRPW